MNARAWYRAAALEPGEPVPAALNVLLERPVGGLPAVVLLAGPSARATGFAAEAALRIARELAGSGHDVVLADGCVAEPCLRPVLGPGSGEGVTDVLLYGATVERLAEPLEERVAYLPTGPAVPDPDGLLGDRTWERVLRRFSADRRTLLVLAPAGTAGSDRLAVMAGTAVVLTAGAETDRILGELPSGTMVAAVLVPPGGVPEPAPREPAAEPDSEAAVGVGEDAAEEDAREGAVVAAGAVGAAEEAEAVDEAEPADDLLDLDVPLVLREPEQSRRGPVLLGALIVFLVLLLAWLAWTRLGGRARAPDQGAATPGAQAAQAPSAGGAPVADGGGTATPVAEVPLPYSVAIESHPDVEIAMHRAEQLRGSLGSVRFFVSPILLDSVVYYRVLAGPEPDSAAAATLMQRLVSAKIKSGADDWSVRPTPWAYRIGDFVSRDSALARRRELAAKKVPTYMLEVADGAEAAHYRLYAGAFEGPALSDVMARMLRDAGIDARLVRRTGRVPE